ncbi:MAG TPA: HAMP domain-containing histidine kinase [Candidatus Aminicenantes bacterium]|nr:HAMP domain-containing histidine kinase [Candidatus Aminicenantes bacterium]
MPKKKRTQLLFLTITLLVLSALVLYMNRVNRIQLQHQIEAITRGEGAALNELMQKAGALLAESGHDVLENFLQRLARIPAVVYAGMYRNDELYHLYTRYEGYFPVSTNLPELALLESPLGQILNIRSRFRDNSGNKWTIHLGFHSDYLDTLNRNARKGLLVQAFIMLFFIATILVLITSFDRRHFRHRMELERERESRERLEELALFSAEIAHEIKNPLNSLALTLEVIQGRLKEHPDDRSGRYIKAGRDEVRRITGILESYSRLSRPVRPVAQRVNLASLLKDLQTALEGETFARRASLEMPALPRLMFELDPDLLRQILRNLIQNSLEAGSSKVKLTAAVKKDWLHIALEDNGEGIDPELQEKVFQPYISAKTKGTGLGLFVARRLVTAMGGEIRLHESRPGKTRFCIRIPRGEISER